MLHVKFQNCRSVLLQKMFEGVKICYFETYKLEQNYDSKRKVGQCEKNYATDFFHFYNSEYLCFSDIPCQNSAKNI